MTHHFIRLLVWLFLLSIDNSFVELAAIGGFYKFALADFGFIFEDNRRTSDRRAELARAIPSEEEEGSPNCKLKRERSGLRDR